MPVPEVLSLVEPVVPLAEPVVSLAEPVVEPVVDPLADVPDVLPVPLIEDELLAGSSVPVTWTRLPTCFESLSLSVAIRR